MSKLKRTSINMISGGAGFFLPMIINFLATPFLVEKLGTEAYGLQSLVNVVLGYLMVADMGLDIPITKFLAEFTAKGDHTKRDTLLSNTFQLYILIGLFGMLVIFIAEPYLYHIFNIPESLIQEAKLVFMITGIGFFGSIMSMWGKAVFIGIHRYDIANGVYVTFSLISTVAGIILVYNDMGIVYFVLARIIGFFLSAICYPIFAKSLFPTYKFSFGFEKEMIARIKPLIGYGFILRITGMIFSRLDQSLLSAWVSISAVGIYSIPFLINMALSGFISGIMNFTFPKASELYSTDKDGEFKSLFLNSTKYTCILASFFFWFLIAAGDRFIYIWIDAEFASKAQSTLLILSFASFITVASATIVNNFLVATNGMRLFTFYTIIKSSAMALTFIILIKPFGLVGAALGVLVGSLCDIVYSIIYCRNYLKIDFAQIALPYFAKPILLGLLPGILVYTFKSYIIGWVQFLLSGTGYVALFMLLGIVLKVFGAREKELILKLLNRFKWAN